VTATADPARNARSDAALNARSDTAPEVRADTAPDARSLRAALAGFATGVTIVTCRDASGAPVGLTVNSFNALSLDPPLVLWSLRRASASVAAFDAAGRFAVHVLAEGQVELSRRFASPLAAKFDDSLWSGGAADEPPHLPGCVASFDCETVTRQDAGDHRLYIGRVRRLRSQALPPLVFHGGHYHLLGEVL
jgi:flavin reductase (DIM6/NTAB) family NADH-FMN oxidoreductase RutF